MSKYQTMKNIEVEFEFDSRADYLHARLLAYDLHIRVLPRLERIDADGVKWSRMFVTAPEYRIWTLMEDMNSLCLYYTTEFGLLVD